MTGEVPGHDDIDIVQSKQVHRLLAAGGRQYPEPAVLEDVSAQLKTPLLVIDQQHG
jgi:hypothetical protein